jgi:shikimate kinase
VALIFITGMPGAGKTLLAKQLADRLGVPFIDTDAEVEQLAGRKIDRIFTDDGEAKFRMLERAVMSLTLLLPTGVVALGGGTLEDHRTFKSVKSTGTLVYLRTDPDTLVERLYPVRESRPLLASCETEAQLREKVDALLALRRRRYEGAHIILDSTATMTAQTLVDHLCQSLNTTKA